MYTWSENYSILRALVKTLPTSLNNRTATISIHLDDFAAFSAYKRTVNLAALDITFKELVRLRKAAAKRDKTQNVED